MAQCFFQYSGCRFVRWNDHAIVHPATLPACGYDSRIAQIGEMSRNFRLAHAQDVDEIADANFLIGNEIEQAEPGAVGQCTKEKIEWKGVVLTRHGRSIYGLTNMSNRLYASYIRISVYKEAVWRRNRPRRSNLTLPFM